MNPIDTKLDGLFGRWKEEISKNDGIAVVEFTKDGIMYKNEEEPDRTVARWSASPKRVLFILKDNPHGESDTRWWLKDREGETVSTKKIKECNRKLEIPESFRNKVPFLKRIAYLFYAIHKLDSVAGLSNDWWYDELKMHHEDVVKFFNKEPFAFIESKKQPGGSSITDSELKKHIDRYGNLLREEIQILNPNIIVCLGVGEEILSLYRGSLVKINKHVFVDSCTANGSTRCFLCFGHPSDFPVTDKDYYESWMYWLRDFLKAFSLIHKN